VEEFFKTYEDHIEGKIDPTTRIGTRPETVPYEESVRNKNRTGLSQSANELEE